MGRQAFRCGRRLVGVRRLFAAALLAFVAASQVSLASAGALFSPTTVGGATTFGGNNGSNSTSVPVGTVTGDVLVSTVESYAFTTITCPSGWTLAWSGSDGSNVKAAACVGVVGASVPTSVHFGVNPPTQVSIVTQAFAGVSTTHPIDAAAESDGKAAPSVNATAGDRLVLSEGSAVWQGVAGAPSGATLGASVNDRGNSQVAQASEAVTSSGSTPTNAWSLNPSSNLVVSGVVALRPASSGAPIGSNPPTTPIAQVITFTSTPPASPTVGGTYPVSATGGGSGNPVVFSIDPSSTAGACSIIGSTVSLSATGTCVVDANQAGNATYSAAPQVHQSFTIAADPPTTPIAQVITFTSTPPASPTVGGTYPVSATGGGSGNPVVFSIDPSSTAGACSIIGSTVSLSATGTCVVDANQAGNATYSAAPRVHQSFTIAADPPPTSPPPVTNGAPTSPPVEICGVPSLLTGPASPPAAAVTVPAGNNSTLSLKSNTTYWFAPGTHTLGSGQYNQIIPANGDVFIGGPGAVINGEGVNDFAFTQQATNVTIEYLTIEDFMAPNNQGVVNHDSGTGWVIEHDTIQNNPVGAAMMIGSQDTIEYNCLTHNGQYGFNAYSANGVSNVVVSYNEISYNDTYGYDTTSGDECGCAGGGKFWATVGATVTDNYVHDNQDPGLWVDTDNAGFNISGNYIAHNSAEGLVYEISYNAHITNNTFVDNAWSKGPTQGLGFPTTALYVSESGSDPRVNSAYNASFSVTGNDFIDNWGGVILWENSNRACGLSNDNSCTLVSPSVYTLQSCKAGLPSSTASGNPDYYDNCRWKTQNVSVSDNSFQLTAADVPGCTESAGCGFNGIFSEYGSDAPYQGTAVEDHITYDQNNHFTNNTYVGPWSFMAHEQGTVVSWNAWQRGPYSQDSGSTLSP